MNELILANVLIPKNSLTPAGIVSVEPLPSSSTEPEFTKQTITIHGATIATLHSSAEASNGSPAHSTTILQGDGYIALPGFIDLHVHGAADADTMDGSVSALHQMACFFAQHGVTSFCPTTMTAPHTEILAAVEAVQRAMSTADAAQANEPRGARILGCHIEGPYISPLYPGAQPKEYVRAPDCAEFRALLEAAPISMITLAPEEAGADKLMELACQHDVVVVIGHTDASFEQCVEAIQRGASQATHTYNAMSGLHHRRPGTLGAVLSLDAIAAQLIADNIHVHPAAMKILCRCKGVEGTILITDAMRAAGLSNGRYTLGGQAVLVHDGECRLADGTLAGSVLTMDRALLNFMEATELPLAEAWPTTSRNAARALGLEGQLGSIGPGYQADLVLLDHNYAVAATIVGGQVVYLRDSIALQS